MHKLQAFLLQLEFLDLPGCGLGEAVGFPEDVFGHQVMAQALADPVPDLGLCDHHLTLTASSTGADNRNHKRSHHLPVLLIRQAHHTDLSNARVRHEAILHFEGMDIFAAPDDQVLDPPRDLHVPLFIHLRLVARVHPYFALPVAQHRFRGAIRCAPVLFHDQVAVHRQLASLANGKDRAAVQRVDDLGFYVREKAPDAVDAFLERVVGGGHGGDGGRLGHAVADGQLGQIEDFVQLAHQLCGDAASGGDAGAQVLEAFGGNGAVLEELELGDEHCGYAV